MPAPLLPWASDSPGACGREEGRHWAPGLGGGPSEPGWEALGRLAPGARALADCVLLLFAMDLDLDLLAVELCSPVSLGR